MESKAKDKARGKGEKVYQALQKKTKQMIGQVEAKK